MSAKGAFGRHFAMLLAYISFVIITMFILMFVVIMPFFTQLFGEIVYIQPENVWVFGLIAILFTFAISFGMNYMYAKSIGGIQVRRG